PYAPSTTQQQRGILNTLKRHFSKPKRDFSGSKKHLTAQREIFAQTKHNPTNPKHLYAKLKTKKKSVLY
ncbi:MAG TPA: hypothetical protein PK486_06635, partial [Trichococcus flocculiformis]|nr:hypothetical protein [Trichococcus flocculiformis]